VKGKVLNNSLTGFGDSFWLTP